MVLCSMLGRSIVLYMFHVLCSFYGYMVTVLWLLTCCHHLKGTAAEIQLAYR